MYPSIPEPPDRAQRHLGANNSMIRLVTDIPPYSDNPPAETMWRPPDGGSIASTLLQTAGLVSGWPPDSGAMNQWLHKAQVHSLAGPPMNPPVHNLPCVSAPPAGDGLNELQARSRIFSSRLMHPGGRLVELEQMIHATNEDVSN